MATGVFRTGPYRNPQIGNWKRAITSFLPDPITSEVRKFLKIYRSSRSRQGLFYGVHPFNKPWERDIGLSVHRYYLEQFLTGFSTDIKGHCLEFLKDQYTTRFGKDRVSKLDIIHKEEGNPLATIVADLTKPNQIPDETFDCIICTYTLHVVFDLSAFVESLSRILKPGGVLLLVVPCISPIYPGWAELWRFTPDGLAELLKRTFSPEKITIRSYGNSLTAIGDLTGLVAEHFNVRELTFRDESYALTVAARVQK